MVKSPEVHAEAPLSIPIQPQAMFSVVEQEWVSGQNYPMLNGNLIRK
jgi:hypothetical protein